MHQIITSLLETDLYKISMGQAIYHQFSDYKTTWTFKCRNTDVFFTPEMVEEIKRQIKLYCSLRFTEDELEYLNNIRWIKGSYVDFLRLWEPRYEDFHISTDDPTGLALEATGTWLNTSMYEIPTLAIVNEVYFRMAYDYDKLFADFKKKLAQKKERLLNNCSIGNFSEFGLRRRLSAEAQEDALTPDPADGEPVPLYVLLLRDGRGSGRCESGNPGEAGGRYPAHLPARGHPAPGENAGGGPPA